MGSVKNGWTARIEELEAEVARLKDKLDEIEEEGKYITCLYCGMSYPRGMKISEFREMVAAHKNECPQHPKQPLRHFKLRAVAAETFLNILRKTIGPLQFRTSISSN